mgnify:CR=1 FL=1
MDLGAPELMILVLVVLVLFGGSQLPKLAKNIGKAQKEFKSALSEAQGDAPATPADEPKGADVTQ